MSQVQEFRPMARERDELGRIIADLYLRGSGRRRRPMEIRDICRKFELPIKLVRELLNEQNIELRPAGNRGITRWVRTHRPGDASPRTSTR